MSFIETDKRHPIMWRKKWYIKSDQIAYMSHRTKHINSSRKRDICWQMTVQFINAVRQIKASSGVAEDNIEDIRFGICNWDLIWDLYITIVYYITASYNINLLLRCGDSIPRDVWSNNWVSIGLLQRLLLRFDFDSTVIRRAFDCLSKVTKVTVT